MTSPNSDLFLLHFHPCFLEAHHQLMPNAKCVCPMCLLVFLSRKIDAHRKDRHCLSMTFQSQTFFWNRDTDAFDCVRLDCSFSTESRQEMYNHLRGQWNLSKPKLLKQRQLVPASKPVSCPPEYTSRSGPLKDSNNEDISMGSDSKPWGQENKDLPLEPHVPLPMSLLHDSVMWDVSPESQPTSPPHSTTLTNNIRIAYVSKILHRWFPALVGSVLIYSSVDHCSE